MDAVWGSGNVVCIHPGGPPLIGKTAVMNSWKHILVAGGSVSLRSELLTEIETDSMAVHVVREVLSGVEGDAVVLATNIYKRYSEGWKIVEHHASQPTLQPVRHNTRAPRSVTLQ